MSCAIAPKPVPRTRPRRGLPCQRLRIDFSAARIWSKRGSMAAVYECAVRRVSPARAPYHIVMRLIAISLVSIALLAVLLAWNSCSRQHGGVQPVVVYAAVALQPPIEELARAFTAE